MHKIITTAVWAGRGFLEEIETIKNVDFPQFKVPSDLGIGNESIMSETNTPIFFTGKMNLRVLF